MFFYFVALSIAAPVKAPSSALTASLNRDPALRSKWLRVLLATPKAKRSAVEYLLTNMPLYDLKGLPTLKVTEAVDLAYDARRSVTWGKVIPEAIFLDSVVPYASVTEPRESMRREFQKKYLPLVKSARTPGEAALVINKKLFKDYHVRYDTDRLRTDQCPPETIAQGMATCTGLSIMLVDALRAVGVPSRLAGIKSWPGRGGNHTWVEVWSDGSWHFIGAAEPDDAGLDHAWFANQAATAVENNPENAIFAVTFRDSKARFPLEWDPGVTVPAENVTARYRHRVVETGSELLVDVIENGIRVKANVSVRELLSGNQCGVGQSLGPAADVNNFFKVAAIKGKSYSVTAEYNKRSTTETVIANGETVVHLHLE